MLITGIFKVVAVGTLEMVQEAMAFMLTRLLTLLQQDLLVHQFFMIMLIRGIIVTPLQRQGKLILNQIV